MPDGRAQTPELSPFQFPGKSAGHQTGRKKALSRNVNKVLEHVGSLGRKIHSSKKSGDNPCADLQSIVPDNSRRSYDVKDVISRIADKGSFFEVQQDFAGNVVVGFARMDGETVGFVANQPAVMGGSLDYHASDKMARFIRFCDCFGLPILTLVDVPAFLPGTAQEHSGIIRHGAKVLYAYSEATVPKISLIMRKAYGGAYIAMNSREMGADYVYAWPIAEIAVMGAEGAVNIAFKRKIKQLPIRRPCAPSASRNMRNASSILMLPLPEVLWMK